MEGLLDGLFVVDLGRGHAGPYCAKLYADAGATVIHVEKPSGGDPSRVEGPFAPEDTGKAFSASHAFLNAGKLSVTLDYTTAEGKALLWTLLERADIVVENSAPGTLERHGFGTETMLARNPKLVRVSISNYGQSGPYRDFPATELTIQAASGLMDGNGEYGREPLKYPMNMAQHWAGANAAWAGLAAYWDAEASGEGQQVDVSIQESLADNWYLVYADYQYTGVLQARGQQDLLPAKDGKVMIRWQTSVPWEEFAIALDAMELLTDPELQPPAIMSVNAHKLWDTVSAKTPERTRREWMDAAIAAEIPAGMLQSLDDIAACKMHESRQFWDSVQTPWGATAKFPGTFYVWEGGKQAQLERSVPSLGEHNEQVICGLLGRSQDELAALKSAGVV